MRATLALVGEHGTDAVTHRAVAERAGVPLSATTYWFSSREELLRETLMLAMGQEVARLERLVLELAGRDLEPEQWADAVAGELASEVEADPTKYVAFHELALEAAREPALRAEAARWQHAHLRLAELGLRAAGSPDPERDAPIVVATLSGLMFGQLVNPVPDFERTVLRPAMERLFARLVPSNDLVT